MLVEESKKRRARDDRIARITGVHEMKLDLTTAMGVYLEIRLDLFKILKRNDAQ